MAINASYPLNALACLGLPELKRRSGRLLGHLRYVILAQKHKKKKSSVNFLLKPFLLIRPPCYCDLLLNVSRFQWPLSGPGNWVSLYPSLKYDRQLSLALLLLKKTGVKADNLQHCLLYFFALQKSAFNSNGFYNNRANFSLSYELVLQLNLILDCSQSSIFP